AIDNIENRYYDKIKELIIHRFKNLLITEMLKLLIKSDENEHNDCDELSISTKKVIVSKISKNNGFIDFINNNNYYVQIKIDALVQEGFRVEICMSKTRQSSKQD